LQNELNYAALCIYVGDPVDCCLICVQDGADITVYSMIVTHRSYMTYVTYDL